MQFNELISTCPLISPSAYCAMINLRNALRRKSHSIRPSGEAGIYIVSDGAEEIRICRRSRHNRSKRGVRRGVDALAGQYGLDAVAPIPGGTFVDCGANVGELGFWARARGMRYVAFEPEPPEARCCDLNNFGGAAGTHRKALWKETTTLEFFSEAETADGSLIAQSGQTVSRKIPAARLDDLLTSADLGPGTSVLKVEAEGAEPEVLMGASRLLGAFDFVTVDCGPERGAERKDTFVETNTLLVDAGFRAVRANFRRLTILYRNAAKPSA